jgi:hypothetical protein
MLTFI